MTRIAKFRDQGQALIRDSCSALALAAALLVLMSPLSRQAHIAESTAIAWALLALVLVFASPRLRTVSSALPREIGEPTAVLLAIVSFYALLGLERRYPIRLIVWEAAPYFEFAAWAAVARIVLRSRRDVYTALSLLIAGAVVQCLGDITVFLVHFPWTHGIGLQNALATRIIDAPPFLFGPIALFLAIDESLPRRTRIYCWIASAIIVLVLLASLTRSYWVGFLIGICVAAAARRGPAARKLIGGTVGVLILMALLTFAAPAPLSTPFRLVEQRLVSYTSNQLHAKTGTLATRRQDELRGAWHAMVADRFLGRGIGGSIPRTFAPLEPTEGYRVAFLHNYFVQVLLKIGIVGFAAFAWVVVAALRLFRRVATVSESFTATLAAGVLAMWIMESAQLLLYPKTSIFHIPAYMGTSLGLAVAAYATMSMPSTPSRLRPLSGSLLSSPR